MSPKQSSQDREWRQTRWAIQAITSELRQLETMPDHKVGKPGSPYSICLIKIASIVKGAGAGNINMTGLLEMVQEKSKHLHVPERESMRMFNRAMKNAIPRFQKEEG